MSETPREYRTKPRKNILPKLTCGCPGGKANREETTYEEIRDMFLQEKFIAGLPLDQARFIMEREPATAQEALKHALVFESAKQATCSDRERFKKFEPNHNDGASEGKSQEETKSETNSKGGPTATRQFQHSKEEADGTVSAIPVYPVRKVGATTQTRSYGRKTDEPSTPSQILFGNITLQELGRAQRVDPTLARTRKLAASHSTRQGNENQATKPEATYRWRQGILYRVHSREGKAVHQVVVPRAYRQEVLRWAHDTPMAGHLGVRRTKYKVANNYSWPGIFADASRYCKACDICRRVSPRNSVFSRVVVDKGDTPSLTEEISSGT
ncbi:hypothetical protein C0Q70_20430 [Pomacea canaliculata]|uniref:Integrase zinc-binding domain-containing protein n=1 Tax=Pomacea canaliculata TaxID=400727 RepID=A0A2T7NFK2_POMCA|nr:hypothetical protein C0Q70_20430 [Pomacea canaliculata]